MRCLGSTAATSLLGGPPAGTTQTNAMDDFTTATTADPAAGPASVPPGAQGSSDPGPQEEVKPHAQSGQTDHTTTRPCGAVASVVIAAQADTTVPFPDGTVPVREYACDAGRGAPVLPSPSGYVLRPPRHGATTPAATTRFLVAWQRRRPPEPDHPAQLRLGQGMPQTRAFSPIARHHSRSLHRLLARQCLRPPVPRTSHCHSHRHAVLPRRTPRASPHRGARGCRNRARRRGSHIPCGAVASVVTAAQADTTVPYPGGAVPVRDYACDVGRGATVLPSPSGYVSRPRVTAHTRCFHYPSSGPSHRHGRPRALHPLRLLSRSAGYMEVRGSRYSADSARREETA